MIGFLNNYYHQQNFPKVWFIIAIFFLSLYSVYFNNIGSALFQIIGMLLFTRLLCLSSPRKKLFANDKLGDVLLLILIGIVVITSSFLGAIFYGNIQFKGPVSFLLGLFLLGIVLINEEYKEILYGCLQIVLVIQLTFWLIQFFSYWLSGSYIDYLAIICDMSTRYYGSGIVHFCGFFQEPSTYACFMIMGLSVRLIKNKFQLKLVDVIIIASVLLSLSILGFFCLLVLFTVCILATKSKARSRMIMYATVMIILMFILFYFDILNWNYIASRAQNPLSDASGYARIIAGFEFVRNSPEFMQIFGKGYGNYNMEAVSANTMAYLLEYMGLLGAVAVLSIFLGLLIKKKVVFWAWILLGMSLLWPSYLSTLFWWFWVGMMITFGKAFRSMIPT